MLDDDSISLVLKPLIHSCLMNHSAFKACNNNPLPSQEQPVHSRGNYEIVLCNPPPQRNRGNRRNKKHYEYCFKKYLDTSKLGHTSIASSYCAPLSVCLSPLIDYGLIFLILLCVKLMRFVSFHAEFNIFRTLSF